MSVPDKPEPVTLDLDAKRAERAKDPNRKGPIVKVFGKRYDLPPSLPIPIIKSVLRVMRGDPEGLDETLAFFFDDYTTDPKFAELDLDDVGELFDIVASSYEVTMGNSQASPTP